MNDQHQGHLPKIELLVFDLGGILIHLEIDLLLSSWKIPANLRPQFNQYFMSWTIHHQFEKGLMVEDHFFNELRKYIHDFHIIHSVNPIHQNDFLNLSKIELQKSWNSMIGSSVPQTSKLIQQLNIPVHLLSNTNSSHIQHCRDNKYDFLTMLSHQWYSYEVGHRKPDSEIYEFLSQSVKTKFKISKKNILFIDDNKDNVLAAKKCGWNAEIGSTSTEVIQKILSRYKLI